MSLTTEDEDKIEEEISGEEIEPKQFTDIQEIDQLKVRKLWAGIASQTTTPTDEAQRGEIRLKDDATNQSLWARLSGAWKQIGDTRLFGGGATTLHKHDHGAMDGLGDDDHAKYTLHDGTRAFTGDQSMGTHKLTAVVDPAADQDAATKKYVDDNAGISVGFHNLILNGDFELWVAGTAVAPSEYDLVLTPSVARDTSPKYGAYCAKVTGVGAANEGISQTIPATRLKPSTTYAVSVWAKATASDTAKLDMTGESGTFTAQTTSSTTWVKLSGTFATDATPAAIVIQLLAAADEDIVWFDNLQVTEGSTHQNYFMGQDKNAFQILGGTDTQTNLADDSTVAITCGFAPKVIQFLTYGTDTTKVDIGQASKLVATQWCYNLVDGKIYTNSVARRSTSESTMYISLDSWDANGFTLRSVSPAQTMTWVMFWTAIG